MVKNKSYTLGLYEKAMPNHLSLTEKLAIAKKCGFDFVELSIDESDEKLARLKMSREERRNLSNEIAALEIPFGSICLSGHRKYPLGSHDEKIRIISLEMLEQAIILARDLGIPIIQLAGYDVYYENSDEKTQTWFLENLVKGVSFAAKHGIILGFETMETAFMDTVAKAMKVIANVQSPYLQVYPDIGNLKNSSVLYNHDLLIDLEQGKGHIIAIHLKETKVGLYREIPFGEGHTPFLACVEMAKTLGVNRFVGEFWDINAPTWQEDLQCAYHFLQNVLQQVYEDVTD